MKRIRVTLKIRGIGNSIGITFPKDAAQRLGIKEGDRLLLTETAGGFRLTLLDASFEEAMESAEAFMERYKNALRALAE